MENIDNNLLSKIQKLLNLQEGATAVGSYEEAENAASKITALLLKHNLDLEAVKAANIANRAQVSIDDVWINTLDKTKHSESAWIQKLYISVARNNLCKVLWTSGQFMVRIIGKSHNVAIVNYICDQLIDKIRIAEKYAWKIYYRDNGDYGEKRGTWRRGFLEGAAIGIGTRLQKDWDDMADHGENPYGLMRINNDEDINQYLYTKYPWMDPNYVNPNPEPEPSEEDIQRKRPKKIKMRKGPRQNSSRDGWNVGYDAGSRMEINKGVKGDTNRGQIN